MKTYELVIIILATIPLLPALWRFLGTVGVFLADMIYRPKFPMVFVTPKGKRVKIEFDTLEDVTQFRHEPMAYLRSHDIDYESLPEV